MQENRPIDELIAKLFSEGLTPDEENSLKTWLNESVENQTYFNQIRNVWHATHPAFDPEMIDVNKAESRVMEKINGKKWIQAPVIIWWQRIAAVLFIPILLLAGYLITEKESWTSDVTYQEIYAPYGVHSKVNLPDGSTVWLNSGSRLKYPVAFKYGERNVYLSGEAYFEVHSDKKNPFVVETDMMKVKATGTAFNVEAYAVDSTTAVTLVRGKVNVDMGPGKKVDMAPNERLYYNKDSRNYNVNECDTYKWCAWKDGILAFRDDRLDFVFKKIGQMYNVDIAVKDYEIASYQYRATFEGESLDEILKLMKMTAPIRYIKKDRIKSAQGQYSKEKIEVYKEQ